MSFQGGAVYGPGDPANQHRLVTAGCVSFQGGAVYGPGDPADQHRLVTSRGACPFRVERSTDQVIRPINIDALTTWVDSVPESVRRNIDTIAPMLVQLGYDAHAYPPAYGQPEPLVADNTQSVRTHADYWRRRGLEAQQDLPAVLAGTAPSQAPAAPPLNGTS